MIDDLGLILFEAISFKSLDSTLARDSEKLAALRRDDE
jgi:hypothetical protein